MNRILIVISLVGAVVVAAAPYLSPFDARIESGMDAEIARLQQATLDSLHRAADIRAGTPSVTARVSERVDEIVASLQRTYAALTVVFILAAFIFAASLNRLMLRPLQAQMKEAENQMKLAEEQCKLFEQWHEDLTHWYKDWWAA